MLFSFHIMFFFLINDLFSDLKDETVAAGQQKLRQLLDEIQRLEREKNRAIDERERLARQLGHINQQLEESEQRNARFQKQITELEQLRPATDTIFRSKQQSSRASIKLTWREGEKAPCKARISYNAAVDCNALYFAESNTYTVSTSTWSQLPDSPTHSCPSVIIDNLFTLIGADMVVIMALYYQPAFQPQWGRQW